MKRIFVRCLLLIWIFTPAFAQSLAERTHTDTPECQIVNDRFEICLIDNTVLAKTLMFYHGTKEGISYFSTEERGIALLGQLQFPIQNVENAETVYKSAFPIFKNFQEVTLAVENELFSFKFSASKNDDPFWVSPYIVTLIELEDIVIFIETIYLNIYGDEEYQVLTEQQQSDHLALVKAIRFL